MRQFIIKHRRSLLVAHREGRLHPAVAEAMGLDQPAFRCSTCGMWASTPQAAMRCCVDGEENRQASTGWHCVVCVTKYDGALLREIERVAAADGVSTRTNIETKYGFYRGFLAKVKLGGFRITDKPYKALERMFPEGVPGVTMSGERNRGLAGKRNRSGDQVHV